MRPQDLTRLRRIALSSQGLLQAQPFGRGLIGARNAIQHLGYVQIDTIAVVERAHHHVFYSRVPKFAPAMTNQLLRDRSIFEYWSHAAAFLPISDFRFSLPYKHAIKSGQTHWFKNCDKKLMTELLARVRVDGPIRSRDIESERKQSAGWWDWKPAKKALEQLYMEGDLMVCNRDGFQKAYDLTERVLPADVDTSLPTTQELAKHLLSQQLRCHGFVSLKGVTYQRRNPELRLAVKGLVGEGLAQRTLEQVQMSNGEVFIMEAGALERRMPSSNKRLQILSPFDNSVIQRARLKSVFQFDYQIECYVPASKRRFGYFCLPLLFGDEFIGRMDCKAHRKSQHLEINSLHVDSSCVGDDSFVYAFADAIKKFCLFQRCDSISITAANPKEMLPVIRRALNF